MADALGLALSELGHGAYEFPLAGKTGGANMRYYWGQLRCM